MQLYTTQNGYYVHIKILKNTRHNIKIVLLYTHENTKRQDRTSDTTKIKKYA